MSYYINDHAIFSSERKNYVPNATHSDQKGSFFDYKSNRMTRKGQLIEEESMLRRMKAVSLANKAHRES